MTFDTHCEIVIVGDDTTCVTTKLLLLSHILFLSTFAILGFPEEHQDNNFRQYDIIGSVDKPHEPAIRVAGVIFLSMQQQAYSNNTLKSYQNKKLLYLFKQLDLQFVLFSRLVSDSGHDVYVVSDIEEQYREDQTVYKRHDFKPNE